MEKVPTRAIRRYGCFRENQSIVSWYLNVLRVPWTARRSNQSILKKINPEYSFEILMLKLQYFVYLTQRPDSFKTILMLGMIESKSRSIRG